MPFYFIPNRKSYNSFENISVKNEPLDEEFWDILNHVKIEDVFDQFNISGRLYFIIGSINFVTKV